MQQDNELKSHIRDLADRCFNREIMLFSDFLSLSEQSEILSIERELSYVDLTWFGGMDECERKMLMLSPKDMDECERKMMMLSPKGMDGGKEKKLVRSSKKLYGCDGKNLIQKSNRKSETEIPEFLCEKNEINNKKNRFPISCLVAEPLMKKFSDELTHRDFLGALMNLGIDRAVLGDIVVKENTAYIFCEDKMADYLCDNFTKVRHTNIKCGKAEVCPKSAKPVLKEETHIVSSNRCDAIISKVFNMSRNQSIELFRGKNVFIDGRQCENNSAELKNGATVSVRGYGKFVFVGITDETRKGKWHVKIRKYM